MSVEKEIGSRLARLLRLARDAAAAKEKIGEAMGEMDDAVRSRLRRYRRAVKKARMSVPKFVAREYLDAADDAAMANMGARDGRGRRKEK